MYLVREGRDITETLTYMLLFLDLDSEKSVSVQAAPLTSSVILGKARLAFDSFSYSFCRVVVVISPSGSQESWGQERKTGHERPAVDSHQRQTERWPFPNLWPLIHLSQNW
jgi:hypothetical protein